ncbi:MAG: hypothetical protein R6W90_03870 [Ignavibacteriaceae bacterium]
MTFKMITAVIVLLLMAGSMDRVTAQSQSNNPAVENSIIIIIHGDGDYLFHNRKGESFLADQVVLRKALKVSEQLDNAEVFIFHQKKRDFSLLVFPKDDADFYYYKNGKLKEHISFNRSRFDLSEEADLYKKYSSGSSKNLLLYYGHEIPLDGGNGYNSSYPGNQFNLSLFSQAMRNISDGNTFDLIVLSTCGNGSPSVIKELSPYSEYIIASPDDLHLSYMNPLYLKRLNYYREYNFEDFVVDFARSSFTELKRNIETGSVISAYKTSELSPEFLENYNDGGAITDSEFTIIENCDCADLDGFNSEEASKGAIVFYNPPSFGKEKYKTEHSGWGCKKSISYTTSSLIEKVMHSK